MEIVKILYFLSLVFYIPTYDITYPKLVHAINIQKIYTEDDLIEEVLDSICKRESGYHFMGEKAYKLISPTADYGKYQINQINFRYGGVCYGITFQEFLNSPMIQEYKARELMKLHIKIIKQYGFPITKERLHKSWFGIAYALQ